MDKDQVLIIDGFDVTPYIAFGGFQWQRSDIDDSDTGRDLAGDLRRGRVATKRRLDITCRPLTAKETSIILTAIMPEFVTVRYYDPQEGSIVSRTMYSNNNPATYALKKPDGTVYWTGVTFPLIEK